MRCHCWKFDGHFTQDWFKLQEMVFSLAIFFCLYLPLNGSLWIFVCVRALFLNIFHLLNSIRQKSSGQFFVSLHVPLQSVSNLFMSSVRHCPQCVSNVQHFYHKTNGLNQSESKWIIFICLSIFFMSKIHSFIFQLCFRFCR